MRAAARSRLATRGQGVRTRPARAGALCPPARCADATCSHLRLRLHSRTLALEQGLGGQRAAAQRQQHRICTLPARRGLAVERAQVLLRELHRRRVARVRHDERRHADLGLRGDARGHGVLSAGANVRGGELRWRWQRRWGAEWHAQPAYAYGRGGRWARKPVQARGTPRNRLSVRVSRGYLVERGHTAHGRRGGRLAAEIDLLDPAVGDTALLRVAECFEERKRGHESGRREAVVEDRGRLGGRLGRRRGDGDGGAWSLERKSARRSTAGIRDLSAHAAAASGTDTRRTLLVLVRLQGDLLAQVEVALAGAPGGAEQTLEAIACEALGDVGGVCEGRAGTLEHGARWWGREVCGPEGIVLGGDGEGSERRAGLWSADLGGRRRDGYLGDRAHRRKEGM